MRDPVRVPRLAALEALAPARHPLRVRRVGRRREGVHGQHAVAVAPDVVHAQLPAPVVAVVGVAVVEPAHRRDRLERRRAVRGELARRVAAVGEAERPDRAGAPGLRGEPRARVVGVLLLALGVLVGARARRRARAAAVELHAHVAVRREVAVRAGLLGRARVLAVGQELEHGRVGPGTGRQEAVRGEPRAVPRGDALVLDDPDRPGHGAKNRSQRRGGVARMLLWEEVPAVDGRALDVVGELAPQRQRAAGVRVPGADRPAPAPQREQRARDPPAGRAVGTVVLAVDRGRGAVLLADRVDVPGIRERLDVGGADRGANVAGRRAPVHAVRAVDHRGRRGGDQALGQRLGLREQRPRPEPSASRSSARSHTVSTGRMSSTATRRTRAGWSSAAR